MGNVLLKCSSCSSPLKNSQNDNQFICPYCGTINIIESKALKIPTNQGSLLKKAAKYEGNSNVSKAIELYDAFLAVNPTDSLVLLARALVSLADSPNDDINEALFNEYFNKGLNAAGENKVDAIFFLMYQFSKYTIPLICVWQVYAYKKICDIDKNKASKRMSKNLSILFKVQKIIDDLEEKHGIRNINNLINDDIETYIEYKNAIITFDNDLLSYNRWYNLNLNEWDIKNTIKQTEKNYKQFCKKYK